LMWLVRVKLQLTFPFLCKIQIQPQFALLLATFECKLWYVYCNYFNNPHILGPMFSYATENSVNCNSTNIQCYFFCNC